MVLETGSRVPQEAVDRGRLLIGTANFGSINGPHLFHVQEAIAKHFSNKTNVLVIPYAAMNMAAKATDATNAFVRMVPKLEGSIHSIHEKSGEGILKAAEEADGFVLGPGNTHLLANVLHREGLVDILRQKAADGIVIAGASAGPLVMADTITGAADPTVPVEEENGKRIVRVDGLGLLPKHVHPVVHYIDFDELYSDDEKQALYKQDPRFEVLFDHLHSVRANINWHLRYFSDDIVYALPDDSYFVVEGMTVTHHGEKGKAGVIFQAGEEEQLVEPGTNLSHLLLPKDVGNAISISYEETESPVSTAVTISGENIADARAVYEHASLMSMAVISPNPDYSVGEIKGTERGMREIATRLGLEAQIIIPARKEATTKLRDFQGGSTY